jgi:hypothetical protein
LRSLSCPQFQCSIFCQINRYLALECLPVTKRVLVESDKVASVCSNIVYYIVAPAMKSRSG